MPNSDSAPRAYERRDHRPYPGAIRQFLTERKLTTVELAELTGYDRSTIHKALRGDLVTWSFANEVAQALRVRFDAVVDPTPVDPEAVTA